MDILGEILKQVLEGAAQQQQQPQQRQPQPQQRAPQPQQRAPQPQQRAPQPQQGEGQGMPSINDLQDIFGQIFGGGSAQKLPEVVRQFEEKGLRDEVDSWVRTGPNKPVDRRQIEDVFGRGQIDEMASRTNVDRERLAEVLSKYIPRIIDELTPQGQMPQRR